MILNINQTFFNSVILYFYQFIFKTGVVPFGFNNIHVVPMKKDKNKSSNDLSDLPQLAQIFERIIKSKIPILNSTYQNKCGYKTKTSCHALLAFKKIFLLQIFLFNKK